MSREDVAEMANLPLAAVITEAYFRTPSTTDFNGIFKGRYIDFEAKETSNATI